MNMRKTVSTAFILVVLMFTACGGGGGGSTSGPVNPPVSPSISSITATSNDMLGGGAGTVSGANFATTGVTTITFGATAATNVVVVDSTKITFTVPPSSVSGTVTVTLVNSGKTLTGTFDYAPPPSPSISSITATSNDMLGGGAGTVAGAHFITTGVTTITFGSTAATNVVVVDSTKITFTVPPSSVSGTVTVTVVNSGKTLTGTFDYAPPPGPSISSITATSNDTLGGGAGTVAGAHFITTGVTTINFGSTAATNVVVVDSTKITFTVPPSSASGAVTVTVVNSGKSLTGSFTYAASTPTVAFATGKIPFALQLNSSVTIDNTVLTASGYQSCTVVPTSTTAGATITTPGKLANFVPTSQGSPFGTLNAGNAYPADKNPDYTVTATCSNAEKSASAQTTLHATSPAPVLASVSPTSIKSTSTNVIHMIHTNTTALAINHANPGEWLGTSWTTKCGDSVWGGSAWISETEVTGNINQSNWPLGSLDIEIRNDSDKNGFGGGTSCIPNAITVVSNSSNILLSDGLTIFVEQRGKDANGQLTLSKDGNIVAKVELGRGSGSPRIFGGAVYVPNSADRTISKVNFDGSSATLRTPEGFIPVLMFSDDNLYLYADRESSEGIRAGSVMRLAGDSFVPYYGTLNAEDFVSVAGKQYVLASDGQISIYANGEYVRTIVTGVEANKLGHQDDTLLLASVDSPKLTLLDTSTGEMRTVAMPGNIWHISDDGNYLGLSNGSVVPLSTPAAPIAQLPPEGMVNGFLFKDATATYAAPVQHGSAVIRSVNAAVK